jgi:uncharacterized membrane protein YdjX (TVP38/TMEM64 family)
VSLSGERAPQDAPIESALPLVWRSVAVVVVVAAVVAVVGGSVDPTAWLTADGLRAVVGAEWYAPIAYVAVIVAVMFLPAPKIILLGLAGVLFGPWQGFLYAWIGQILGMTALFLAARASLRPAAQRLMHEHLAAARNIDGHLETHGFATVALLRLFYFMGSPLTVMLSATKLRLLHFMAGTAVGVIPAIGLAVASADAATSGTTGIGAAIIGLGIVLVLGVGTVVRRRFGL